MRFHTILPALALGAACFFAQSAYLAFAQEEVKEEAQPEVKPYDFSLLDVPEGKDEAFYCDLYDKIELSFIRAKEAPSPEDMAKLFEKLSAAMKTIYKGLENATDKEAVQRCNEAFEGYVGVAIQTSGVKGVQVIYEEEKAAGKSKKRANFALGILCLAQLREAKTDDDYRAVGDVIVANAKEIKPYLIVNIFDEMLRANPSVSKGVIEQVVKVYNESGDETLMRDAYNLAKTLRLASLPGNEVKVEGLLVDGTEINWESYRGKVVLLDFWATWCGPCVAEIPNVLKLYEKYRDAGFEVVGFSQDYELDVLEKFLEEKKLPWKTVSEKRTIDATIKAHKEGVGKKYLDLAEDFGIIALPTMILVGRDGKAISINARGAELKRLLEEQFPDVK